jgi:hypothetical protein
MALAQLRNCLLLCMILIKDFCAKTLMYFCSLVLMHDCETLLLMEFLEMLQFSKFKEI